MLLRNSLYISQLNIPRKDFFYTALTVWNEIPFSIRKLPALHRYRTQLKVCLFGRKLILSRHPGRSGRLFIHCIYHGHIVFKRVHKLREQLGEVVNVFNYQQLLPMLHKFLDITSGPILEWSWPGAGQPS